MTTKRTDSDCEEPMPHSVPRGFLRVLIMSLLRKEELTGSEIMDIFEERSEGRWKPSPGSIYPLLESLKDDGLIEIVSEIGRSKKYRITKQGTEHFKMMHRRRREMQHKTSLSRLLWLHLLPPPERVHFHLNGILATLELLEESIGDLNESDKTKASNQMDLIVKRLTDIKDSILKEE